MTRKRPKPESVFVNISSCTNKNREQNLIYTRKRHSDNCKSYKRSTYEKIKRKRHILEKDRSFGERPEITCPRFGRHSFDGVQKWIHSLYYVLKKLVSDFQKMLLTIQRSSEQHDWVQTSSWNMYWYLYIVRQKNVKILFRPWVINNIVHYGKRNKH